MVRADVEKNLTFEGKKANRFKIRSITGLDFVFEASAGASGTLYMDDVILSGEKAEESTPDVFTDVPEGDSDETDPSGKTEKEGSVLVPVMVGAAVLAAAAAVVVLLKSNKKSV